MSIAVVHRVSEQPSMTAGDQPSTRHAFIEAMSRCVTGVTVVTTDGPSGRFGQTVSASASVSADPPMVLVCINRRSPIRAVILEHGAFGVNALRADQRRLSESFAGRPRRGLPYDFTAARWERGDVGSPLLVGAVAAFDCRLDNAIEAGTHTIFIGDVRQALFGPGVPLVYARRAYGELAAMPSRHDDDRLYDIGELGDEGNLEELWS